MILPHALLLSQIFNNYIVLSPIDTDECSANICGSNGGCEDQVNSYLCHCYDGYSGTSCDVDIDECESNPCLHGNCTDEINHFNCTCNDGYEGPMCTIGWEYI